MTAHESATSDFLVRELLQIVKTETFRDPLLDDVRAGRMSRPGLKFWSLQAALVVKQFPRFISAIHANCPYADGQQLLVENLWEEHGGGDPRAGHYTLIRRLARSLGATAEEIDQTKALPETGAYIDHCLAITRVGTFVEGLAAVGIGIEYFIPKFFGALAEAFQQRYGLSASDVAFLLVHVRADAEHARRSLDVLERYAGGDDDSRERVKRGLKQTLSVKRAFAESVYRGCLVAT
ncbi:MAG TPA: iron-containing redox enzyme family protein [Blastocatellia bacterium]|nr:iron-containing redox enzyme family protein [Blastocatellia bacterium]